MRLQGPALAATAQDDPATLAYQRMADVLEELVPLIPPDDPDAAVLSTAYRAYRRRAPQRVLLGSDQPWPSGLPPLSHLLR
jgi:hypothetical protein